MINATQLGRSRRFSVILPAFLVLFCAGFFVPADAAVLVGRNATWRYRKGTAEASDPRSDWRQPGFDDSSWSSGGTPMGYGLSGLSKTLSDMPGNYSCIFLRKTFSVSSLPSDLRLRASVDWDDGFIMWINGERVLDKDEPDGTPLHTSLASDYHTPGIFETNQLPDAAEYLELGENVIAVQVFNKTLNSSDCKINVELASFQKVADTKFSRDRGYYDAPFSVTITTATPGATIRYTTDGSAPSTSTGTAAGETAVVAIPGTTCLRAAAFKSGYEPTDVDTQSYILVDSVFTQTRPAGYPTQLPPAWDGSPGGPWTYSLDPGLVSTYGQAAIEAGIKALPTVSIVGDYADTFSSNGFIGTSNANERLCPISMELIYPDNPKDGFQIDCAARRHKSWDHVLQRSFKVHFNDEYGPKKLRYPFFEKAPVNADSAAEKFDRLVFRGGANHSFMTEWISNCYRTSYVRDPFVKASQTAISGMGAHTTFMNVYLNGLFWGVYDVCERTEHHFGAEYMGGEDEDWFACNHHSDRAYWKPREPINGDPSRWYYLREGLIAKNMALASNYNELKQYLAVSEFCDYMLVNWYCGTADWPGNNWYGIQRMTPEPGPMYFYSWDAECSLREAGFSQPAPHDFWTMPFFGPYQGPTSGYYYKSDVSKILRKADDNLDFRMLFADRAYELFFNDGVLTDANAAQRWTAMCDYLEPAITPQSARFGNHIFPGNPVTVNHWRASRDSVTAIFNDGEAAKTIQQMRANSPSVYPAIDPPGYAKHGGAIGAGFSLTMTNPNSVGTLVYKTDGSDPRKWDVTGGKAAGAANYGSPIALNRTTHVKARVRKSNATWSALRAATFNYTAHYPLIKITEIMYNPIGGRDFEFIELKNTSGSTTVGLSEMTFKGVKYTFAPGTELAAGQIIVLAANATAFEGHYGFTPFGEYEGALDNGGERIRLLDCDGATVTTVKYNDKLPWPKEPDGAGYALVFEGTGDQDDAAKWRRSNLIGGTPGYDAAPFYDVVISEALTHTDLPSVDAVELHNAGVGSVNIGGWYLSDTVSNYKKFQIPSTTLGPGGYAVFDENDFGSWALDSHGDEIYLTHWDGNGNLLYLAEERFGGAANGVAFARHVCSDGDVDFVAQSVNTTLGSANAYPKVGPVVINEIMYNPLSGEPEFIELLNISGGSVQLYDPGTPANRWTLDGAVEYEFPASTTLAAGELVLVASTNEATVRAAYPSVPAGVRVFGPYDGRLNNGGESIKLWRPDTPDPEGIPRILVDRVKYGDNSPWPESPDGDGLSLERIAPGLYGNDPANWAASLALDGTPGEANSGALVSKTAGWRYHDRGANLGTGWRNAGYDDSGWQDGNAPLGYPDTNLDIDTEMDFGDDPANKHITTYFRTRFMLGSAPADVTMLKLRARYDDGYVAYLNGQEVARAGMPAGTPAYNTLASGSGSGTSYQEKDILGHKNKLVQGLNVLAVEVHQNSKTSSDIFMDMDLRHSAVAGPTPPAAPTNVAASPLSTSRIRVSWTDNATDEDQYKIRWGTTAGSQPNEVFLAANTTSWTHTGLSPNSTHYYKVRAQNAAGTSGYVGPVSATTQDTAPAIAVSTTSIAVSCVEGTDAASETFDVWNGGGSTLQYKVVEYSSKLSVAPASGSSTGSGDKKTHTITFTTASLAVGVYDRTINVEDNGSGAANSPVTIDVQITVTQGPPDAPTGFAAEALSATEVRLTWNDLPDEDDYMLRTSLDGSYWYGVPAVYPPADATSYTATGLDPETQYWFKIRGRNAGGLGPYCSPISITTPAAVPPAIAVSRTNIAVSCNVGQNPANETFLVWNSGAATLQYNVVESTSKLSVAPTSGSSTGSGDKTTHTITFTTASLAAGTYDRTITVEDNGSGAANSPVNIAVQITVSDTVPAAPSGVSAAATGAGAIQVTWQDNASNETQYKIRWGLSAADQPNEVWLAANTTTWQHTGLAADTVYYYKVRAQNAVGTSAYVGPVNARTTLADTEPFTAYNDLAWDASQSAGNITMYTRAQQGLLVDHGTGKTVPVTLTLNNAGSGPYLTQGRDANAGTDADTVFGGRVDCAGLISYATNDLVLGIDGLSPTMAYELVLFGNRDSTAYAGRTTTVILEGAASFANASTAGATVGTSGAPDDTTTIANGSNRANGWVARYRAVDPGQDGAIQLRVPAWSGSGDAGRYYLNALMLKAVAGEQRLIEKVATWRYRKGTAEASSPIGAWRAASFDDSGWSSGPARFGYSSNTNEGPFATELTDMKNAYSCLFLRREFVVDDPLWVSELKLLATADDGFIAWINGQEVARDNVTGAPGTNKSFDDQYAPVNSTEPHLSTNVLSGASLPELGRTNVLAVQVFNYLKGSSDFVFEAELFAVQGQLSASVDPDQDMTPDAWETATFGDASTWTGADDPDLDGQSNTEEFIAGTGANSGTSYLAVDVAVVAGQFTVSFPTIAASGAGYEGMTRYYALQRCDTPGGSAWTDVPGFERIEGLGQTVSFSEPAPAPTACFRARAWLEQE